MRPEMPTATAPATTTESHSNYRWVICGLLFWVTTANYIDRGVFGNLAPEMPGRLHVSKAEWDVAYWNMQIFFQAAYAVSMLLMGRLMDGLGLRWGFAFACTFWGLASMSHAFAPEIGSLFGSAITGFFICRILLGLGEGGNFPAAIKTTAEWFPKRERALATGLFNSGSNVGGLLVPWALPFVIAFHIGSFALGWRGAFFITAIIDLSWIIAWLVLYKKPEEHPRVSKAELALIQSDAAEPTVKIPWRKLLPHKQMWAYAVAKFMTDCFWWFYLFGSPDFFNKKFNLDPAGRKYMIMMIYVIASVGSIAGGWLAGAFMNGSVGQQSPQDHHAHLLRVCTPGGVFGNHRGQVGGGCADHPRCFSPSGMVGQCVQSRWRYVPQTRGWFSNRTGRHDWRLRRNGAVLHHGQGAE